MRFLSLSLFFVCICLFFFQHFLLLLLIARMQPSNAAMVAQPVIVTGRPPFKIIVVGDAFTGKVRTCVCLCVCVCMCVCTCACVHACEM